MGFTGLIGFYWGMVHHPDPWAYACGIYIFRRCMVWHLWFLLSLASRPLSLMEHLRFSHVCCACTSLRIPVALAWCFIGVLWYTFCQIHQLCIFPGDSDLYYLGVLRYTFFACPWSSLASFLSNLQVLTGVITRISPSWGDPILW